MQMQETYYQIMGYQITEVVYAQTEYRDLSEAIEDAQQTMMAHPEEGIHVKKFTREVP